MQNRDCMASTPQAMTSAPDPRVVVLARAIASIVRDSGHGAFRQHILDCLVVTHSDGIQPRLEQLLQRHYDNVAPWKSGTALAADVLDEAKVDEEHVC